MGLVVLLCVFSVAMCLQVLKAAVHHIQQAKMFTQPEAGKCRQLLFAWLLFCISPKQLQLARFVWLMPCSYSWRSDIWQLCCRSLDGVNSSPQYFGDCCAAFVWHFRLFVKLLLSHWLLQLTAMCFTLQAVLRALPPLSSYSRDAVLRCCFTAVCGWHTLRSCLQAVLCVSSPLTSCAMPMWAQLTTLHWPRSSIQWLCPAYLSSQQTSGIKPTGALSLHPQVSMTHPWWLMLQYWSFMKCLQCITACIESIALTVTSTLYLGCASCVRW